MAMSKANDLVSSNGVMVFSKSYCPYCHTVKKLLTDLGASFKAIELNQESDGSEIQAALGEWTDSGLYQMCSLTESTLGAVIQQLPCTKVGNLFLC